MRLRQSRRVAVLPYGFWLVDFVEAPGTEEGAWAVDHETGVIDRSVFFYCVGPPGQQRYFSPRNTCLVDGTCSGIFLCLIRHVPLGFFYLFDMPLLWRLFPTCIVGGACSCIFLRIIRHVPLGSLLCRFYDDYFADRLIIDRTFFCSKVGLFFYGMAGLSKQYRHAHII